MYRVLLVIGFRTNNHLKNKVKNIGVIVVQRIIDEESTEMVGPEQMGMLTENLPDEPVDGERVDIRNAPISLMVKELRKKFTGPFVNSNATVHIYVGDMSNDYIIKAFGRDEFLRKNDSELIREISEDIKKTPQLQGAM